MKIITLTTEQGIEQVVPLTDARRQFIKGACVGWFASTTGICIGVLIGVWLA